MLRFSSANIGTFFEYTLLLEDSCGEHELQDGIDGQFVEDL
jgi:hypothetical protein